MASRPTSHGNWCLHSGFGLIIFFYTLFPPLASYHSFFRNWKWTKPKPSLLPPISQHSHGATPPGKTHEQRPSTIQPRTVKPPGGTAWPSDGLLLIRKSLQSRGISQATQDIILNSWRTATQRQYRVYLEKWQSSADRRAVDPLHPSVKDVLEFLQGLYERGLGYSCLNTVRSVLSSFIVLDGNVTVGNHPLV